MATAAEKEDGHQDETTVHRQKVFEEDLGHRLGNFHNYYSFHPLSDRLGVVRKLLASQVPVAGSDTKRQKGTNGKATPFVYCDLGCNEGDLTIGISKALRFAFRREIRFEGLDIDPELVWRATEKWNCTEDISGAFRVANICDEVEKMEDESVDMMSLLSTTMWIHVHVGDKGLEELLLQMCKKSRRYLLVEPQPSKCYRNAEVRLRRMGRPELDVSLERLKWRSNLEHMIERTLNKGGFFRVGGADGQRTSWNRVISLFDRGCIGKVANGPAGQDPARKSSIH